MVGLAVLVLVEMAEMVEMVEMVGQVEQVEAMAMVQASRSLLSWAVRSIRNPPQRKGKQNHQDNMYFLCIQCCCLGR
jgi:hypothetical protein